MVITIPMTMFLIFISYELLVSERRDYNFARVFITPPIDLATAKLSNDLKSHRRIGFRSLQAPLSDSLRLVKELKTIMNKRGLTDSQKKVIEVEVTDLMNKLSEVVGEKHYLSIVRNTTFWNEPKRRIYETRRAVKSFNTKIKKKIILLNKLTEDDVDILLKTLIDDETTSFDSIYNSNK